MYKMIFLKDLLCKAHIYLALYWVPAMIQASLRGYGKSDMLDK